MGVSALSHAEFLEKFGPVYEASPWVAEGVWPAVEDGRIRQPHIRALPLAEAARAHALMEDTASYGKIVLLTDWGAGETDNSIEMA